MQLQIKLLYGLAKASHHQATYYPHYKKKLEIIKSAYNLSFFWPTYKQISLLGVSFHCITKVINPLHDVPDASKHWFAIYYLHYKDKFVGNPIRTLVCAVNNLYFLSNFGNLSASLKKANRQELSLYLSHCFQPLACFFSPNFANLPLLANYPSVRLTNKAFFDLSYIIQKVEFLSDDITPLNKRLQ